MSNWTENDTKAEIARIVESAKRTTPPLEAAVVPNPDTIAQAIRDLLAE